MTNVSKFEIFNHHIKDTKQSENFRDVLETVCAYYSLFLIIFGCTGNLMSYIVLSNRAFRTSTMSVYLRFLSVMDSGVLLTGATRQFFQRIFNIDTASNDVMCKILVFSVFMFTYMSSWTLVIVTTERVISVTWPHRVQILCTHATAKIILLVALVFAFSLSYIVALEFGDINVLYENSTIVEHCQNLYLDETLSMVLFSVDAIVFAFLPSFLLILFNIIIVLGVVRSADKVKHFQESDKRSADASMKNKARFKTNRLSKKETSLTMNLVAINIAFITCNFPSTAWNFVPQMQSTEGMDILTLTIHELFNALMFTNSGLNFVLYCFTGSKFRSTFKSIIQQCFQYCKP